MKGIVQYIRLHINMCLIILLDFNYWPLINSSLKFVPYICYYSTFLVEY